MSFSDVLVGLEVHQQLDTGRKLFCGCKPSEPQSYSVEFRRRMRPVAGERGAAAKRRTVRGYGGGARADQDIDLAVLFEDSKSNTITYRGAQGSSCLVEYDEEPPHDMDAAAKDIALTISAALHSDIVDVILPMRKIVTDGSNTSGFQRTMLISQGGYFEACGKKIGIQTICLEEDAAKILDSTNGKAYGLERLGVPLVEIATEPFEVDSEQIKTIALELGRILRSTKRVRRGLGTIRQDVNVSVGGGTVVEIKGVQQLDLLQDVVEHEVQRQRGILEMAKRVKAAVKRIDDRLQETEGSAWRRGAAVDIADIMEGSASKIITGALKRGETVLAMGFPGLGGLFGYEPYPGVRLGREISEVARALGIGGLFHSDELPNYGVTKECVSGIMDRLKLGEGDAFVAFASPNDKSRAILEAVLGRIEDIMDGVPADTRMALPDGRTKFLRPKPGGARMYPETDIPAIFITAKEIERARENAPKPWKEIISDMRERYGLNAQLAEQIMDSEYLELFEAVCSSTKVQANFVASMLCSSITSLERKKLDRTRLTRQIIWEVFSRLDRNEIPKDGVEAIFEGVMSGKSPAEAMAESQMMADEELEQIISRVVSENPKLVQRGERGAGPLMGIIMKEARGRASGKKISDRLRPHLVSG